MHKKEYNFGGTRLTDEEQGEYMRKVKAQKSKSRQIKLTGRLMDIKKFL
jgi:hypothetical protein